MTKIQYSFPVLLQILADNMPLRHDFILSLGFDMEIIQKSDNYYYAKAYNFETTDGICIREVYFRNIAREKKVGTIFILDIGKGMTSDDMEKIFGTFAPFAAPRGKSEEEGYSYILHKGDYSIRTGYSQQNRNIVRSVTFDSVLFKK